MRILPSLLEYNAQDLGIKLQKITQNLSTFLALTNQDYISLHLDFVLPEFAQKREIQASLDINTVLSTFNDYFSTTNLDVSVHLMGEESDLNEIFNYLRNRNFNPNWNFTFYIPFSFNSNWANLNQKIGYWYDVNQWSEVGELQEGDYLIMTVEAGKSGQELLPEIKEKCKVLVTSNPESHFIFDGGWKLDTLPFAPNIDVVSYSDFWQKFVV